MILHTFCTAIFINNIKSGIENLAISTEMLNFATSKVFQ